MSHPQQSRTDRENDIRLLRFQIQSSKDRLQELHSQSRASSPGQIAYFRNQEISKTIKAVTAQLKAQEIDLAALLQAEIDF